MSESKSLWSRLFGKGDTSSCCAVRIEAVPEESKTAKSESQPACCAVRVEEIKKKPADPPST